MKYYVIAIEQVHTDTGLGEYATKSDPMTQQSAYSTFYDKCAAVNKDLSDKGHTFMDIKVVNSTGGIIKKDELGEYVDLKPQTQTQTQTQAQTEGE